MFKSQEKTLENLIDDFCKNKTGNTVITLAGKAGVGKTYIINELIKSLDENKILSCYIAGDHICINRDYYCMTQALTPYSKKYNKKKRNSSLIVDATSQIPYVGRYLAD